MEAKEVQGCFDREHFVRTSERSAAVSLKVLLCQVRGNVWSGMQGAAESKRKAYRCLVETTSGWGPGDLQRVLNPENVLTDTDEKGDRCLAVSPCSLQLPTYCIQQEQTVRWSFIPSAIKHIRKHGFSIDA